MKEKSPATLPAQTEVCVTDNAVFVPNTDERPNMPALRTPQDVAYVPEGLETMGKDDLILPRLTIVQPTSKEGNKGMFRLNLTGEEFSELKCVFFKITKGRVLFSEDLTKPPVCGSIDRVVPSAYFGDSVMDESCGKCLYAQWTPNHAGKNDPPKCKESLTLIGWMVDHEMPFIYQVKVMALKPTQMFASFVYLTSKQKKAKLCDYEVKMSTKGTSNAKGTFWIPAYSGIKYITDNERRAAYRQLSDVFVKVDVDFEADPSNADDETAGGLPF